MSRLSWAVCVSVVLGLAEATTVGATTITYQATDLADLAPGEDLWQYEYAVSGHVFVVDQGGFSVFFDPALYASLQDGLATPDWDVLLLQPDSVLPADGLYDALALVGNPSLAPFSVSFVWLGGPASVPGPQRFEVYQMDLDGNVLPGSEFGQTTPVNTPSPIPEPSTLLLLGSGLSLAIARRRS